MSEISANISWNPVVLLRAAERAARALAQRDGTDTSYQQHLSDELSRTVRQLCEEHNSVAISPSDGVVVRVKNRAEVLLLPERDLGFQVYALSLTEPIDSLIRAEAWGELIRAWEQHQAALREDMLLDRAGVV
jgi:hypothetical protein